MLLPRLKQWLPMGVTGAAAILVVMVEVSRDALWVGHDSISLKFLILDAPSGRPIEGATILLPEKTPEYRATTGQDGVAELVARFMVAGRSSFLRQTRSVNYSTLLKISAEGHRVAKGDLQNYTQAPRYHSETNPPLIVIRLEPDLAEPE
jgi:hypothetical protein